MHEISYRFSTQMCKKNTQKLYDIAQQAQVVCGKRFGLMQVYLIVFCIASGYRCSFL
jgi:hypothetical protein